MSKAIPGEPCADCPTVLADKDADNAYCERCGKFYCAECGGAHECHELHSYTLSAMAFLTAEIHATSRQEAMEQFAQIRKSVNTREEPNEPVMGEYSIYVVDGHPQLMNTESEAAE